MGNCIIANSVDSRVQQLATTTNSDYEVLFSGTADNATRVEGARKNNNLKFNPSTGNLQATKLNGVTIGNSPKFSDTTYTSKIAASGGTDVSLVTTGEKYVWNNKGTGNVSHNTDTEAGAAVTLNADQLQGYSLNQLLKLMYPVGAVYQSTNNSSPANFITGTTWTLISSVALASEHVFGNEYNLGITNGTGIDGLRYNSGNISLATAGFGVKSPAVTGGSGTAGIEGNTGTGVVTKNQLGAHPEYSGLIADTITVYMWERTA